MSKNPLDDLKIDMSILEPMEPPRRAGKELRSTMPAHLRQDFFGEYELLDKILERGAATLSGYTSRSEAWSARQRFYWARAKHRYANPDSEAAWRYDPIFIRIEPYKFETGETFWSITFKVSRPVVTFS